MDAREMAERRFEPRLTYTVAETAAYTGISDWALTRAIRAGELRACVPKGQTRGLRIRPEDVDKWIGDMR